VKKRDYIVVLAVSLCLVATSCNNDGNGVAGGGFFSDKEKDKAIGFIKEANANLKKIKALYRNNKAKKDHLVEAFKKKDIKKVKVLADDLLQIMIAGSVLAETAKESIDNAEELNIDEDWKEYLILKSESLDMQIKAFDSRIGSAKYLRDNFSGESKLEWQKIAALFKKNEEKFFKNLDEAKKVSNEANKLMKEANNKKRD